MVNKKDISLVCIAGIFILGLIGITDISSILVDSGINDEIISPFKGVIKNYWIAYWVIGIVMIILS